ncbi:ATP-dependent nuclease [Calidifontibacillus erzurumensis]|uniref:AAA family ATPase n=1 Tax=Calidifontibacillus erzurumensis TaxID=2741433 RepID=A0A8J8GE72_9BACI|nr:AAA family ATPase [Calidifontibacillus erzurumensis]NSL51884.1 AAA family ATPase [Calidifontibacillus erzurumensis]
MKFVKLQLKNFRNFEDVCIELDNKNIIFGMNDVGKTNFMYALRFLLDREIRKQGFSQTDFHKNDISKTIEIILTVDLSDFDESEDTKKLVSQIKGARTSESGDVFHIKLEGKFDDKEMYGNPILKWGDDLTNLHEVPMKGVSSSLDNVFKVVYINPLINLEQIFSKNKSIIFNESESEENDSELIREIKGLTNQVNEKIGQLSVINNFETAITNEYRNLKDEKITIEMKSEMAIKGFFSDIIPYIKKENDDNYYPTSGDGRRKLLSYSIINHVNKLQHNDKILIYLIEEPENSLHRSLQIAFSKQLFENASIYKYFFITTHSAEILYYMDDTRLIRIYSRDKVECSSYLYYIDSSFKSIKKKLNRELSNALFAEKVLLVEGPSEKILFEKILSEISPNYELNGGYILEVGGTSFKHYIETLNNLEIKTIVKTDNDLRARKGKVSIFEAFGLNRCLKILGKEEVEDIEIVLPNGIKKRKKIEIINDKKRELFRKYKDLILELKRHHIYLSEVDLENDLYDAVGSQMEEILETKDPVTYLQNKKLFNMVELIEGLTKEDCEDIISHENFRCLKELYQVVR